MKRKKFRNQASILVGLLWCLVLLSIVVVSVLHTATMDLRVAKNYGDKIQAHYLALAGIEKTKALLHQAARNRTGNATANERELYDSPTLFRDIQFGRGQYRIFHMANPSEGGGIVYGVSDEESRLNINTATVEELAKLNGLGPDVAAAILAWRGETGNSNPGGATADYYTSLKPPYQPRNGPFQTIRELLMVRGVTPELLFGRDSHQNGFLPPPDDDENNTANLPVDEDGGWASILTTASSDANVSAAGTDRVNIQSADETSLAALEGITPAIARAITQYRNQNRFQSIADLLDVTASGSQGRGAPNPLAGQGGQLIDEDLFTRIADNVTADSNSQQAGLININTASLETLLCLPGMDREHAQAIINSARSQGGFPNIAWLLKVPGMDHDVFKQIAQYVTTRSETFRIVSEGKIKSTGVNARIQAIVHVTRDKVTTVSYREDDL